MKFFTIVFFIFLAVVAAKGQSADTAELKEVVVKSYFTERPLLKQPSSVGIITTQTLKNHPGTSLLPAINTVPGVRMEERSPGSYRLSIRGSLLRSPFGIRNVKVYLDDFLLTDAGGNTYLNILDASSVKRIEILKGPEGSIFGANSGGVVLINSQDLKRDSATVLAGLTGGYYSMFHQYVSAAVKKQNFSIAVNQAVQQADGYRENSEMKRKSIQLMPTWNYSGSAKISSLLMYSDLQYQTPGGLTLAQYQENPTSARPGAAGQQAAVYNKTLLGGLSHEVSLTPQLRHVISLTGSSTDFENFAITNFETRKEKGFRMRTYLDLQSARPQHWSWQYGLESQSIDAEIRNSENLKGEKGKALDFVDFTANQSFLFSRFAWQAIKRLNIEGALSLNFSKYSFEGIQPKITEEQTKSFASQLMPRVAMSYLLTNNLAFRGSASRGYSSPTIEEVRPSNRLVNTLLQPETGWSYEAGIRHSMLNNRFFYDVAVFQYNLKNAIVRRLDAADEEFFLNAGGTRQKGLEAQLTAWILPLKKSGVLRGLKLNESYTHSNFKFKNYQDRLKNFSGNSLTGVPQQNLVSSSEFYLPASLHFYVQHSYVSSLPLNDANTAYADKYHLMQAKLTWQHNFKGKTLKVFGGADNLLNDDYSLGNDLNVAFGERYFNPAPKRNFYGGLALLLN